MTVFFRVLDAAIDDKAQALQEAVTALRQPDAPSASRRATFETSPDAFAAVPGSPFAYWVGEGVRKSFLVFACFQAAERFAAVGLQTSDDFRFLRTSWEVSAVQVRQKWFGFAKGGAFSRYYADVFLFMNWNCHGSEAKAWAGSLYNGSHWSRIVKNTEHYFRPGLTWPRRTQGGLGLRVMPAGCIFADKGPAAFVKDDKPEQLLALLAITTSRAFCYLVSLQMAFGSYEVGVIQRTPVPALSEQETERLARLSRRAWSLKRSLDTRHETSHAFVLPAGLNERMTGLDPSAIEAELDAIQQQLDAEAYRLYGIEAADQAEIEASASRSTAASTGEAPSDDAPEEDEGEEETSDVAGAVALTSWLVGVSFGRFDPRLATGERMIPPEPEPFDRLPSRSPGMYPEGDEPAERPDLLVDDNGHADDLESRVRAVAEQVAVEVPEDLRSWLADEFFPLHIKQYSKSRRKAPIYWQLATPSASYSVWLYLHAFSRDTLFRVQNDYATGKLNHEERRLNALRSELRDGATAAQRKELAAQEGFVEELKAFVEEVKRVTPLWNPHLDDGVILNFALLWRLVPQHKAWQKELKATWDALCEGKHDWSHLSMQLWPERVVPKCATDRSLAIAHGVEDVFWVEGRDGKWSARKTPTRSVDALVQERTSPAVKAALKGLLEAPVASGAVRKTGKGR